MALMTGKISEEFNDQYSSVTKGMTMPEYFAFMAKACNYLDREAAFYRALGKTEKAEEAAEFAADIRSGHEAVQAKYIADLRAEGFDLDPHGNIVFYPDPTPNP